MEKLKISNLERRAYPGAVINFLLSSDTTNHMLSIVEMSMLPGSEPMRHYHQFEDETIILQDGHIEFHIGDQLIVAKPGDIIFMPRLVPHSYQILSPMASAKVIITPSKFELFLREVSHPYNDETPPPLNGNLSSEEVQWFLEVSHRYGIHYV